MRCEVQVTSAACARGLRGARVISESRPTSEAREKALRPPARIRVGEAVVLQQCGPPNAGGEGESLPEGAALHPLLSVGSACVGAFVRCKIREGAGRRARRPRRRAMFRGDYSHVC